MKKIISIALVMAIFLSTCFLPVLAESGKKEYGYIKYTIEDSGETGQFSIMKTDNHIAVDAKELGKALGYTSAYSEAQKVVSFSRTESTLFYDSEHVIKLVLFYHGSTEVKSIITKNADFEIYEAPFKTIVEDGNLWVPLYFALLMLDSSMIIANDGIIITMPRETILTFLNKGLLSRCKFDFSSDFGYSTTEAMIKTGSSHLVNTFKGLLTGEGDSILQLITQFWGDTTPYDSKYGDKIAKLFVINSFDELEEAAKNIKKAYDVISPKGKLAKHLTTISKDLDDSVGQWKNNCDYYLDAIKKGNSDTIPFNAYYNQLEKALSKQDVFTKNTEIITGIHKDIDASGIEKSLKLVDTLAKISEALIYASEFNDRDLYALEALKRYCQTSSGSDYMAQATIDAMQIHTMILDKNMAEYMAGRFILKNWKDWVFKPIYKTLGAKANIALLAWSIASGTIPFLKNGLSSADSFELAMYAGCFQASAYVNADSLASFCLKGTIDEGQLYKLAQDCYVDVKAAYIMRDAAVGSLDNIRNKEKYKDAVKVISDVEIAKNKELAGYLDVLKSAQLDENGKLDNSNFAFGFLPSDNKKYLELYDDSDLIRIFTNMGQQDNEITEKNSEHGTDNQKNLLTEKNQRQINIFLSNFSETGLESFESRPTDQQLIDFADWHVYLNSDHLIEMGEWTDSSFMNGYANSRLSQKHVETRVKQYFNISFSAHSGRGYKNGYYYWEETGGRFSQGFTVADSLVAIGDGEYKVTFKLYSDFGDDSPYYAYTSSQAENDENLHCLGSGTAVIKDININGKDTYYLAKYKYNLSDQQGTTEDVEPESWTELYMEIIKDETWPPFESSGYENDEAAEYVFYDIDKDGVFEMFFTPNPNRAGTGWSVYTIEDNKVVEVTSVYRAFYDIGNNTIISRETIQGHHFFSRFTYKNGIISNPKGLASYEEGYYEFNGEEISKQEYESYLATYFDFDSPNAKLIRTISLTHNDISNLK